MKPTAKWLAATAAAAFLALGAASPAAAQEAAPSPYRNVVSANPLLILFEWFNAEYERVISPYSTVGLAGSYITLDDGDFEGDEDDNYLSADAFFRYYPQGQPLEGFSFGTRAGITSVDETSFFGIGFDANYSWLLGKNDSFYVGVGVGAKRIFGADENEVDIGFLPSLRLVNIGFAF